ALPGGRRGAGVRRGDRPDLGRERLERLPAARDRGGGPPRPRGARLSYSVEAELPGMLHAWVVRSPYPHARVLSVDVPGVVVSLTAEDVRRLRSYGVQIQDQTVLAERPRHVGDPVAAVAAESAQEAEAAAAAVFVDYEELPAVLDVVVAAAPGARLVHE